MRKTFKYRLFTTPAQETALQHILDSCRWVYNRTLEVRRDTWQNEKKYLSRYDTNKLLTMWREEYDFLCAGHAQTMQDAQKRVDLAFRAFFRRVKNGDAPGYPRFRSQRRYDSFTYPQEKGNWRFLPDGKLRISKVGDIDIVLHRPLEGECKTLTLRRDLLGNWYACFSCIVDAKPLPPTDKVTGVDVGIRHFITMSNGEQVNSPKFFRQDERELAKAQRKLTKAEKGTPKYHKRLRAVEHIHQRIANRRRDFAHKLARMLVNKYQLIAFEELNTIGMLANHRLAKSIADAAWGQLIQFTQGKAEDAGRTVILVDAYNTSQLCSGCGAMVRKDLSVRVHACPHCGLVIDRDHNAALNIAARGLTRLGANP